MVTVWQYDSVACIIKVILSQSSIKTNPLIELFKEYLDLKNKLTELRTREKLLLERRSATCSTSSAEPSPPCTTPSSSGATSPIPSSRSSFTGSDHPFSPPLRAHIRVFLPNHQYTVVKCRPDVTLREALDKGMRTRGLTPETCLICHCGSRWLPC